jgi:hypothetical protein
LQRKAILAIQQSSSTAFHHGLSPAKRIDAVRNPILQAAMGSQGIDGD